MSQSINEASHRALIVFARYPCLGQVKTRLASTLGAENAALFYRSCAEWIFMESSRTLCLRYLFYADERQAKSIQQWAGSNFLYAAQSNGDLGRRMLDALNHVFTEGHTQAIIIGTDIPNLTAEILTLAFQLLDQSDVVIGPTFDGGYYLIGMRKVHSEIFANIAWSTPVVMMQTLQAVADLRLSISILPTLMDIDTEEALRQWLTTSPTPNHFQDLLTIIEK